ncbi:MAG: Si-specific NAD(P)(+) transhydrogenase [Melioribacteraceae bacterium]|nr:Si-specific NAD(P)(+) transhydrogenase [Melioribacteraceae bacterium]MCF8412153.1 Si-specific NAD(P)(+) transhydrogenase [Melioribacteraceae bacterium]
MNEFQYDVIVIGSGPGGEGAAMKAVKGGKKVAVCDNFTNIGGNCTHVGTIPSKALRHASEIIQNKGGLDTINYQDLLRTAQKVIDQQVDMRSGFYQRNMVDVIDGYACFIDKNTIDVKLTKGGEETITSEYFIIATGSHPYHPDDIDFSHPRILDSDSILDLKDNPRSLTIYGAGVIGCEYASIFRGLRAKVNLINTREQLLSFLDDEIIDALSYHLRENGVLIRHNEEYEKIVPDDNGVTLYLKSNKKIRAEYLLWAQGRTGNSAGMGLDNLGIEVNHRGSIVVNRHHQTHLENIYAVGDIVGFPSLASASYDQGRFAATHLLDTHTDFHLVENIPTGIYTLPEISSVGPCERELTEQKVPYEVGRSFFKHLARAQITGHAVGVLKILFHRETLEILGIHCFGHGASEIIHIGQAIMSQKGSGNTLMYFVNTTFNYPTMAEAYRVAALNGINRVNFDDE